MDQITIKSSRAWTDNVAISHKISYIKNYTTANVYYSLYTAS